jgi:hypothetical protein
MASKFRPRLFGNHPMFDPLDVALYYAHKHLAENPEPVKPDTAQAVADDAARRVARNTTGDTKRTAQAMGVDLLGGVK